MKSKIKEIDIWSFKMTKCIHLSLYSKEWNKFMELCNASKGYKIECGCTNPEPKEVGE